MPASVDSKPLIQTISPLDATLMKNRGRGARLWLTKHPIRMLILSERSESKGLSSNPTKDSRPACPGLVGEQHRETTEGSDLVGRRSLHFAGLMSVAA